MQIRVASCLHSNSIAIYLPHCRTQRYCSKTVTIDNVTIPEGAEIEVPIDLIHHNPEYWPDPYKFDPERYMETLI